MAITEDGSTPAVVSNSNLVSTLTTASFSPPANSLLVAIVGCYSSGSNGAITVTDSGGHTWTKKLEAVAHITTAIWECQLTTAPGSITVSGAYSNNAGDEFLAVRVLNGAATSQTGAGTATHTVTSATTADTYSLTTTQTNSVVYGIAFNYSTSSGFTPNAATTAITPALVDTPNGANELAWKSTSATTTPGATTFGGTWGSSCTQGNVALEILPAAVAAAEGGRGVVGLAGTGTGAKVAPTGGSCALGLTGTGIDRKAAPQIGSAAVGLTATGVDTKHAPQAGTSAVGVTSTSIEHRTAAQGGTTSLGVAGTGTPHKTAPNITGRAALGLATSGTAAKVTAESGRAALGLATSAIDRKLAPAAGAGALGLTSAATDRKTAPQRGAAAIGAAGTAVEGKAAITGGPCAIGLATTHTGQENKSVGYLGLVGLAGPIRKIAISSGVCALGLSSARGTAVKTIPVAAVAALGLTGTGTEVKFIPPPRPWPPRALSVVLTRSDKADTELTKSYQATVTIT
jgi:hypothetical protein